MLIELHPSSVKALTNLSPIWDLVSIPERGHAFTWKPSPKWGFCVSGYCSPIDEAAHHVTVADKKSDAAKLTSPAARRCTATVKTSRTTDTQ